jgi:alpha-methylacyl-CoA racemase
MHGALQGLKILDLSSLYPGPLATMILADLGAEVLRLDPPDRPDFLRWLPPLDREGEGAAWRTLQRGKRSISLDLRQPAAKEVLQKLVATYDIVLEQFRPGVLDRLGVGYEALKAHQPGLIWCSISSYGQHGPRRDLPGHDLNFLALSGLASHMGRPGQGPASWNALPADTAGATWPAVTGILAAVVHRLRTGEGQRIDIAMADGALFLNALSATKALAGGGDVLPSGEMLNGGGMYDFYPTADDRWLAVGALEPKFWAMFCAALERPEWLELADDSPGSIAARKAEIAAVLQTQPLAHWQAFFEPLGCCVDAVRTSTEAVAEATFRERGMVVAVAGPDGVPMMQLGNPIRLERTPPQAGALAVVPGHDTAAVLAEVGYTEAEIADLLATRAAVSAQ